MSQHSQHSQQHIDTALSVSFCDPHSPWQRGTNENTNGLLRQYFPKGTDLSEHSPSDLDAVAAALNGRPAGRVAGRLPQKRSTLHARLNDSGLLLPKRSVYAAATCASWPAPSHRKDRSSQTE